MNIYSSILVLSTIVLFVWLFITQIVLYKYLMDKNFLLSNNLSNSPHVDVLQGDKNIIISGLYLIPLFWLCLLVFIIKIFIDYMHKLDFKIGLGIILALAIFYLMYFFFYSSTTLVIPRLIEYGSAKELNILHIYFARVNNVLNLIAIPITLLFLIICLFMQYNPYYINMKNF